MQRSSAPTILADESELHYGLRMGRTLSHAEARAFYDRFGAKQDLQRFYEDRAIDRMLEHAGLGCASAVVEFGCGTGRLAERLLGEVLPETSTYVGIDQSRTMIELAEARLARWRERARVTKTDGAPTLPLPDGASDRFVSTYVFDLLSEADIRSVVAEAHRVLRPGGRACLVGLTFGESTLSRVTTKVWSTLHTLRPSLVGGCRPIRTEPFFDAGWETQYRSVFTAFGVCSEILVATRLA